MSPLALVFFNLLLALIVITVIHFSVRAYIRNNKEKPEMMNDRRKLIVFNLVLAIVVIAIIQIAIWAFLRTRPPTVETMMKELNISADFPQDELNEGILEELQNKFSTEYGVDIDPEEKAHLQELLKGTRLQFDRDKYIRMLVEAQSRRNFTDETTVIRQMLSATDPGEREKNRIMWSMASRRELFLSEEFRDGVEPVYNEFASWWKKRHPEYEEMVEEDTRMGSHEELMERYTKSLRSETVLFVAHQLQDLFETALRRQGTALSDAKRKKAFNVFLRLSRSVYTKEVMGKMAAAIIEETKLTDEEILHCLLLKDRPLPDAEKNLAVIQGIRDRYLEPDPFNEIPPETAERIKKELAGIIGIAPDPQDGEQKSGAESGSPDSDGAGTPDAPAETGNDAETVSGESDLDGSAQ